MAERSVDPDTAETGMAKAGATEVGTVDRTADAPSPIDPGAIVGAAIVDILLVVLFVVIGRGNHNEGFSPLGTLQTLWPFLAGLALGWVVTFAWRHPRHISWPGIPIWLVTIAAGMLLRMASGQGVQLSFVIVASVALGIFLVGWRVVARLVQKASRRRAGR
ncbi:MAG: rane protein [Leifsonia sp.]|jgi:hypothetical protein|nr:rane protein [Leifsonia sp.]